MVLEHEGDHASRWAAIASMAANIGCTPETLRLWVKRAERESGRVDAGAADLNGRVKALERENRELRQANEILRKADGGPQKSRRRSPPDPNHKASGKPGGGSEARERIRSKIAGIELTPRSGNDLAAVLTDELATILALSAEAGGGADNKKLPVPFGAGSPMEVVAGARFELTTFRL